MKCQFYVSYVDDILVVFRYIQINFLIFIFTSKCFFFLQIFVAKGDTGQFFLKNSNLWTIQVSLTNLQVSWIHGFNILIQKCFPEKWEQIYQFSLNKSKTTKWNSAAITSYESILQSVFVISWFMKLTVSYMESSFPVIVYLTWNLTWIPYFLLFNLHKFEWLFIFSQ